MPGVLGIDDAEFARFGELIFRRTGIHLRDGKRPLLITRLAPRLRELGIDSFAAYYRLVQQDRSGDEARVLVNRITTNTTSFFRDRRQFELLADRVLPALEGRKILRIWSAACATGEEPYSIAITIRQALGPASGWKIRILATDIDTDALAVAEAGRYALERLQPIPQHLIRAHFRLGYGAFAGLAEARPELRDMIEFRRVNLNEDGWNVKERFDAIFCRNVIIYFDRPVQERIVRRLVRHLEPDGYYFAGSSENLFWLKDSLDPLEAAVYRLHLPMEPGA